MAPSIFSFRELRRRSRASFRTDHSSDASTDGSNGTTPTNGSLTPPSLSDRSDPALNNLMFKDSQTSLSRSPVVPSPNTNRYSVTGMSGPGSPGGRPPLPMSQYAPRIANLTENAWVYQKTLLVHGTIGEPFQHVLDGTLTVCRLDDNFPPISWPVCDANFKALIYLQPGPNRLRFDFASPKLANTGSSSTPHSSYLTVHMLPPLGAPPLQLAILLAKDSPGTFDSPPTRIDREGNSLETAVRKFRTAAYLWQAFTAEQMWRNKLGRRVFRLEEEWTTGTSNRRDREIGTMRSEAKIHIIRSDRTLAEIRDLDRAQQNPEATQKSALFDIAAKAVSNHFKPLPEQKLYVTVLLLDSHWDIEAKTITGHAALGGNRGNIQLSIFGSHCLHSYPSCFEEISSAFTDCTPTDTNFVANDCNEAGSAWEAANIGIGAHLHEVGHLFGCPHQEHGIMMRDYVVLNRSFVPREAYSTRTRSKGGIVTQDDECEWHRLDCLRFRSHPCFRLPNDPPLHPDDGVHAYSIEGGSMVAMAPSGISYVEIRSEGDDLCRAWVECLAENGSIQRQVTLTEQDLRDRLPENKRTGLLSITIRTFGGGSLDVDDIRKLCSKEACVKFGSGRTGYRSVKLGLSAMEGSESQEVIFTSAAMPSRVLSRVIAYHGSSLDGLEFVYDDDSTQLFGKRGGKPGGDTFELDVRRGEYITGFHVRSGFWVDAVQILTSLGRKSAVYGNANGGSGRTLVPPRGYSICGVSGSCGAWVDGFSVVITNK